MAENYTTYTEVDPDSDMTVTASRITFTNHVGFGGGGDSRVYDDKGAGFFNGNFTHLMTSRITSAAANSWPALWVVADDLDNWNDFPGNPSDVLMSRYYYDGSNINLDIREIDGGSTYNDNWGSGVLNTIYYSKIVRDETIGTYGTIFHYIYSDAARTTLVTTLSVTLHTSKKDFRYIYGFCSAASSTGTISGYIETLVLTQGITGGGNMFMGVNF